MKIRTILKQVFRTSIFIVLLASVTLSQDADIKGRFESEYLAWKNQVEEHEYSSFPQYNEHMFEIVQMGAPVLPFIIEKMERNEFKMDFLLVTPFYFISGKAFKREDWPEGTQGDAHTKAAMYIDWWHNGIMDAQNSFNQYYLEWKRSLADKSEDEAKIKLANIKMLGIAAIPLMIEKINEGDLVFIKIISYHTYGSLIERMRKSDLKLEFIDRISDYENESLSENATKEECIEWWNENKDKYTIVQDK